MERLWYWEYILKVWNDTDSQFEIRSGIISAHNLAEAAETLEGYYGEEIQEVQMLKPIVDSVFEFELVNEDHDFDFTINRKEEP